MRLRPTRTYTSREQVLGALEDLVRTNERAMAAALGGPGEVPALYQAGVEYRAEPPGREDWLTAHEVHDLGHGDCEDLACYRAAELRTLGLPAWVDIVASRRFPGAMHAVVRRPGGVTEDPSLALAKGRRADRRKRRIVQRSRRRKDGTHEVEVQAGAVKVKAKGKSKDEAAKKAWDATKKVTESPLFDAIPYSNYIKLGVKLADKLGKTKVAKKVGRAFKKLFRRR